MPYFPDTARRQERYHSLPAGGAMDPLKAVL